MKDQQPSKEDQPDAQDQRHVLADMPEGTHSSQLIQPPDTKPDVKSDEQPVHVGSAHKKPGHAQATPSTEAVPTGHYGAPTTPSTEDSSAAGLQLPNGALVTLRRSGGIRFSSKQVTVYQDGRVEVAGTGTSAAASASPHNLSDAEFAELYRALDTADLANLPAQSGHQSPDAYAYEITADLGARNHSAVAYDGSIPEQLAPLVKFLSTQLR